MKLIRKQNKGDGKEVEMYNKGRRYMVDALSSLSFADAEFRRAAKQPEAEVTGVLEEANDRLAEIKKIQDFIKATWKS